MQFEKQEVVLIVLGGLGLVIAIELWIVDCRFYYGLLKLT